MLPPDHLRGHYVNVIREIMAEHNVEHAQHASYIVQANAEFGEVIQHTDRHAVGGVNSRPHYRYDRYSEVMALIAPSTRRIAHVDVGCGAGLFSWVFLDWATDRGLECGQLELYGLDHSPAMIALAYEVRARLTPHLPAYPDLHYADAVDVIINELTAQHRAGTDYIITHGHVLAQVQAQAPGNIENFARIIYHILQLPNDQANYTLIAVDAQHQSPMFTEGWGSLLANLDRVGINHYVTVVPKTFINDDGRAKYARLHLIH